MQKPFDSAFEFGFGTIFLRRSWNSSSWRLIRLSIGRFFSCDLELTWFRDDSPHFDSLTEFKTRAASGYLYGLLKTVRLNDKETCNCFLGFRKRPVRHGLPARENFAVMP